MAMQSKYDLTGKRFGFLTVVKRLPNHVTKGGNSLVVYECKCDCGNLVSVTAGHLRTGHTKSCGKCDLTGPCHDFEDLTGQQFGFLTVVKRAKDHVSSGGNKFVAWDCECECGNHIVVTAGHLKTGHTKSCGKCGKYDHSRDFTGEKIGRLTVVERLNEWYTYPDGSRDFKWLCKCDCGEDTVTRGNVLRNTRFVQSCGCWRHDESIKDEDMVGRQFGYCKVLSRADRIMVTDTCSVDAWNCLCENCGNHFVARGPQLRFGKIISCGCASRSKWEVWLSEYLDNKGILYTPQKSYDGLRGVGNLPLTYDFCIHTETGDVLVECQGLQHYQPVDYFGGDLTFEKQVEHDIRKRNYALSHHLPLIELNCSSRFMKYDEYLDLISNEIGKYLQ